MACEGNAGLSQFALASLSRSRSCVLVFFMYSFWSHCLKGIVNIFSVMLLCVFYHQYSWMFYIMSCELNYINSTTVFQLKLNPLKQFVLVSCLFLLLFLNEHCSFEWLDFGFISNFFKLHHKTLNVFFSDAIKHRYYVVFCCCSHSVSRFDRFCALLHILVVMSDYLSHCCLKFWQLEAVWPVWPSGGHLDYASVYWVAAICLST